VERSRQPPLSLILSFMKYSDMELRNLAGRAMPLHQRWRGGIGHYAGESEAVVRLEQWRDVFSIEGDEEIFARRLAFDGLDLQTCLRAFGSVWLPKNEPFPVWVQQLSTFLLQCRQAASDHDAWVLSIADEAENSLPFWEIWVPFVTSTTQELRSRAGETLNDLSEDALCSFQSQLLTSLVHLAALPLGLEFRRFVAKHDPLSILEQAIPDACSHPRDLYSHFVRELCGGGLLTFFHEYAVLGRLMAEVAAHWIEHIAEFCGRLHEDRAALANLFNRGLDVGPVVQVRIGLSDPHHGGRDVIIPTFASGLKIVYKPKDLGIDEAFLSFISWLNDQAPHACLPLRTLTVFNRTTHGWVEFVEHQTCQNPDEVRRYYTRIGMLLCLAYVLGGTDFHQENIIANGEQPVLLDLETMVQPMPRRWDGLRADSADQRALEIMHESVLRTGLLPFWSIGNPGKSYDVSGIGAEEPSDTGYLNVQWENINTDRMRLVYHSLETGPRANRPTLNGELVSAENYVSEMTSGFTATYRVLLARREILLRDGGPLSRFRGLKLRCLLRLSKAYVQILNRQLHPEFLRDGVTRSIELERLARDFVVTPSDPEYPPPWGIYRAEAEALERLDIPFFAFFSDSDALYADNRVVAPAYFSETGLQRVFSLVRKLSEEDLRVQADFIRASVYARYADRPSEIARRTSGDSNATDSVQPPLTRSELVGAAVDIADQIRRLAIRGADGGITWLSLAFDPTVDRMNVLPMTDNLYDGRIGVSFFLAALEHVTGGAGFRDSAVAALMPLRKAIRQCIPPVRGRATLGGAVGLGGQLYALVRIAGWLNDDELLHLAGCASAWFIPKRIAGDEALDVFGGSAGGILGLLALSAAGANGDALDAAVQCGHHLLKQRLHAETGHLVWPGGWTSHPLTGFSHGAAGIAYALLRLSHAAGEQQFRQAAEEGIAYETAVYSHAARNWPDFRDPARPKGGHFMVAWCNGAAGIGLGRLGGLPALDTAPVRRDIANALETTRATPLATEDHICCGNLGRLDLLAEASRRLGRPALLDEACHSASVLVRRAARSGRYGLFAQVPGVIDSLSLFHGTAGIGYQLLRLAQPDKLPCALLWE
jgi:class II lanthipeptide synthase